jgi:hypothetical protein
LSSDPAVLVEVADTLWRAEKDRVAVAPITDEFPAFSASDA